MATTLNDITTEFYNIVNQTADDGTGKNTVYTLSFVQNLANVVQQEIARSYKFPFLQSKLFFDTGVDTTFTSDVATSDTTLTVGATASFESAGSIWSQHDIIAYTGKTSTTLTGVTGIDIAHTSGRNLEFIKQVPSDFGHSPELWIGRTGKDDLVEYHYVLEDDMDTTEIVFRFTTVYNSSAVEFIRLNNPDSSQIAVFKYYKTPATMTDNVDTVIPDQFALQVIPRIMAGVAMIIRDDNPDDLGSVIREVGRVDILELKRFYTKQFGFGAQFRTKYKSQPQSIRRKRRTHG